MLVLILLYVFHDCRHYPIGVLFDLYGSSASLPWNLTVHFQVMNFTVQIFESKSPVLSLEMSICSKVIFNN